MLWYPVRMIYLPRWFAAGLLLLGAAGACAQERWTLTADAWARPRDGLSVARMAPLPEVVSAWSAQPDQRVLLRYPGGEEGLLWAHELRGWLVALGVPLADQEIVAGSSQADRIEIEVTR
ncbi:MAG: hypothetical protein RQ736_11135 [Thiogranum sp.]|nr:hypothetical protein [Thiogranum sp.]